VEGSCEHYNEPSGSIKCWEVLEEGLSSVELAIPYTKIFVLMVENKVKKIRFY
jgi:hypothetical protein